MKCSYDFQKKAVEVRARRSDLKNIEDMGAILEEHLILDNRYTEHSTVGLAQVFVYSNYWGFVNVGKVYLTFVIVLLGLGSVGPTWHENAT